MPKRNLKNTFQERLERFRESSSKKDQLDISARLRKTPSGGCSPDLRSLKSKTPTRPTRQSSTHGSYGGGSSTRFSNQKSYGGHILKDISNEAYRNSPPRKQMHARHRTYSKEYARLIQGGGNLQNFFKSKKEMSQNQKSRTPLREIRGSKNNSKYYENYEISQNQKSQVNIGESTSYIDKVKSYLNREYTPTKEIIKKNGNIENQDMSLAKKQNLMERFGQALKNQKTKSRSKGGSPYNGGSKQHLGLGSPTIKKTMNLKCSESLKSKIRKANSIYSRENDKSQNKSKGTLKSSQSSRDVTPKRIIPQKQNFVRKEKFSDFKKFYEVDHSIAKRFGELTFLERTGEQLYLINKVMKRNSDVYDSIRKYADYAQEREFDQFSTIFHPQSKPFYLLSSIFKLERWATITLFYFNVASIDSPDLMRNLARIVNLVWENQNLLANWIKELNIYNDLSWVIRDPQRIYYDVQLEKDELIGSILENNKRIIKHLQMT